MLATGSVVIIKSSYVRCARGRNQSLKLIDKIFLSEQKTAAAKYIGLKEAVSNMEKEMDYTTLPKEIWSTIFSFLSCKDLNSVTFVDLSWNYIANNNATWKVR